MSTMGQKHSKQRPKKLKSQPEVTEIFELKDNSSEIEVDGSIVSDVIKPSEQITYPIELKKVIENVESIEKSIQDMSGSQINLYYPTLKDDLHNNWQTVYDIKDADAKDKKIETIQRIKNVLKKLNGEILIKGHATCSRQEY